LLVRLSLFIAVSVGALSCEQDEALSNLFLPMWTPQPDAAVATGELPGRLEERNGCLLWSDGTEFLPLWPTDFEIDRVGLTIETTSGAVWAIGDSGTLGGGERTLEQAESLIGEQIPRRCHAAGGYWMVTDVLREQE
jgi:hypothetical protein